MNPWTTAGTGDSGQTQRPTAGGAPEARAVGEGVAAGSDARARPGIEVATDPDGAETGARVAVSSEVSVWPGGATELGSEAGQCGRPIGTAPLRMVEIGFGEIVFEKSPGVRVRPRVMVGIRRPPTARALIGVMRSDSRPEQGSAGALGNLWTSRA